MRYRKLVTALIILASPAAFSQQPGTFQGKWSGPMKGQGGGDNTLELTIGEAGGTWHMTADGNRGRANACLRRDFPVVVTPKSPSEVSIEIKGAQILQGCIDQTGVLKLVDGKAIEGSLADGRTFTLTRR